MLATVSDPSPGREPMRPPTTDAVRIGVPFTPLTDFYFVLLKGSWLAVLGIFMLAFLVTNLIFAGLYLAGGDCIAGARPGSFADAFYFSVQTIATIGYGALTPTTDYANTLVAVEAMLGLLGTALSTGIIFAKFARPRANVRFTDKVLISPYDGQRSLYFRVANIRGNDVSEAKIGVAVLKSHLTAEGHQLRRLHELDLVRARTPMFRLSWLVIHVIDETSALWGMERDDLFDDQTMIVVSFSGVDSTFAQAVNSRHIYMPQDVVFDHHFEDIIGQTADGRLEFDYTKFNSIRPLTAEECRAGQRGELEDQDTELLDAEVGDACVLQLADEVEAGE